MSVSGPSAYRLEQSRSRRPPPPLKVDPSSSSFKSSPHSPTLLYDLPSATSLSPPNSPRSLLRSISPPSSPRTNHRTPSSSGPTGRNRSQTPGRVPKSDLEKFSECCRRWYFDQDEESGRIMTETMANLPQSQRAPFSRLQASIRSAYHRSVNARRTAEFKAHLSATQPGGSLTPHARADPNGPVANKERYERFERFLISWCTMGMPGPQPFFQSLWTIMRLQVLPENLRGAGRNRIEWTFDDAVFKEAAGKDFMLEAIDVLKGVLGFEEVVISDRRSSTPSGNNARDSSSIHSRSKSQPMFTDYKEATQQSTRPHRARAPSDPFLDTPLLSRSASTHQLSSPTFEEEEEEEEECPLRTWTSPDLANPELICLIKLFPSHISRRALAYFPSTRPSDIEEGCDEEVRVATGTIRVSAKQRSDGWEGGWWTRFLLWWRKTFC